MIYALLTIFCILIVATIIIYNSLVKKKNMMKESWSGIDVYLKKRYDLIPNLIETVKGYTKHEQGVVEDVTRQRTAAMQSAGTLDKINSETELTQALGRLMVIAENYPDLKASTNFQQLQTQLESIESEIEMSRRYYNGTVRENNILIESFPMNIVAALFKFEKGLFFEIKIQTERETPKVSF